MEFPGEEDPDEVLSLILGVSNAFSWESSAAFARCLSDEQPSPAIVLKFSLFWIFTTLVVYWGRKGRGEEIFTESFPHI
jgi:hypothetical protein